MRKSLLPLVAMLLVLAPAPAGAHAALVSTDPEDGAVLDAAPSTVTLEFNEPVTRSEVVVTAPDGSAVPVEVAARDRDVVATLGRSGEDGQQGTYTVAYRVVSADGHPITGTSTFESTSGAVVEQAATTEDDEDGQTFLHRHAEHLWWGVGGGLVALALIAWPLVRRERS